MTVTVDADQTFDVFGDEARAKLVAIMRSITVQVTGLDPADLEDDTYLFPEVAAAMGIDPEAAGLNVNENVSLDSLDMLDILVGIEDVFGVEFNMEKLETGEIDPMNFSTLATTSNFIAGYLEPEVVEAGIAGFNFEGQA